MDFIITEKKATICLNMIVKNESHIIENTLEKLCKKINFDYWVICDTGSTDNTPQIITDFFEKKGIKGELFYDEWVNFAHNRTLALERAYKKTDLLLVFDADDEICGNIEIPSEVLYDEYHFKFGSAFGTSYTRVLMVNNHKKFEFLSVIHEFISCKEHPSKSTVIEGNYYVVSGRSGSRNLDPDKYLKDALILEKAHAEALKTNDQLFHRYAFYCANSYKDCGRIEDAIKWYKITINQEKQWPQEKYVSCLYLYDCYQKLNEQEKGFFYLVKAFTYDTERVECIYPLLVHYCCENMYRVAYNYYLNIKDFFENRYLHTNISTKLFTTQDKYDFFVPYYMILIADKVQDFECVVKMYEIVFTKKQRMFEDWYVKNLLYNLQFFLQHVPKHNTRFVELANEYFKFIHVNGVNLQNYDFLVKPEYKNAGILLDNYIIKEVTNKPQKFSTEICKNSKNIIIYTGFSDINWNYTYMQHNALGGSEKAVAYLSKCYPKDYNIYISGHVNNETIDNIRYIHLDELPKLIDSTPFHTVIVSRYISFYEMFKECSFYQSFIWAHDVLLLPYGCSLNETQILSKWDKYINKCVCLTEWHRSIFSEKYPTLKDKITLINNGIDLNSFNVIETNKKIKNKFIYSSRPDRGLNILLKLWPSILEKIPDATLVVSSYGTFPSNAEEKILKNIIDTTDSIKLLGKLNTYQLYSEMETAEYWLYPTHWPETSCITALEMLMSEVICLYYPVAGLTYTMDKYGIQIIPNSEINTIVSLTDEQKNTLRKKGREYAEQCSWKNRYKLWHKLLSLDQTPIVNVNENANENDNENANEPTPCKKHIAIFNSFNFHYEMYGYIIEYCKTNNYLLTIFTSFDNTLGWIDFYTDHFKNYKFDVKNIYTFEEERNKFDIIFITTDDDYEFKKEWINDKCVSVNHTCMIRRPDFKNNLGTRPFIKNYKKWAIPCYNIFQENNKENTSNKYINVSIIGGLNDYNYATINRLDSSSTITLYIIARNANYFNTSKIINKKINVILLNNIDTKEMINFLKKSDYILTDSTYNIHHINGISMSGNIPLAFSTLTPLIISKGNNSLYKFKNVIEFDIKTNDKIIIEKGIIDISRLEEERQKLISLFNDYNDILISPNKNTALIVDPRNISELPYLINDFKKKLGNNWRIVFYCGKGLQNTMNQYIENGIEIRELNVNNFTLNEYSDFMKTKKLWDSLYGEFVLTFQADTYILNKSPYTIDYFIEMNKSYIGGNMDHGWNELNRENIYPNYKNFNGGLSLRKRKDMIQIIDTYGTEKTEHNSQKMQTDPEDVYFTIGCYKLNYPIGDTEECQHFSLNRIWIDKFFGIHKPIPAVLENVKEITDLYCKETNTFILKPKKESILFILPNWYNPTPLEDYFDSLKSIYNIDIYSKLNWFKNEDKTIKIIDCFTFYNELNMLNYRLNILNDVVDYFILVEAKQTHVGKPKKIFFDENKQMFEKFNDKIIHIVVDLPFNESNINISNRDQWTNEKHQRNCINQGIDKIKEKLSDNDYIIISDVDEIPDPKTLFTIKNKTLKICDINSLSQDFYYYTLNIKRNEKWCLSKILSYKKYNDLNISCSDLRFFNCNSIEQGGWHLSYFGDSSFIKNKLENFAHQEYNSDNFTNTSKIDYKIKNGLDLFDRQSWDQTSNMTKISIDNNTYLPPLYETYLSSFYEKHKPNILFYT
jgi:beta-1,4-mannosyl-glycoprotein beta-1,4-N-acetylglucosaminyltransferase